MAAFWMFCIIVTSFYSTQLSIVLAGRRDLESSLMLTNWIDLASTDGNVESWDYRKNTDSLKTDIKAGRSESWFNTPSLSLPKTSYLVIEASCHKQPCQLEINGTSDKTSTPTNFEFIQNVTFEKQSLKTITIKKAYRRLRIIARTASPNEFTIYSIKMYHYFCEKETIQNTFLNKTDSSTTNISVIAECGDNAVASDGNSTNITANCTPKGNWTFGDLKCICDKGFQSNSKHGGCSRCSIYYYKSAAGVEECRICPNGTINNTMHTKCNCKEEHYTIADKEDGRCYTVPSKVGGLQVQPSTNTSVNIIWEKPKNNDGFKGSLTYTVECYRCINDSTCDTIAKNAMFVPAETNLKTTYVIVSNLTFNKTYKFKIFSMRSLENVPSGKWKSEEKTYTLNRTADKVSDGSTVTPTSTSGKKTSTSEAREKLNDLFIYIGANIAFLVIVLLIGLLVFIRFRRGKSKKNRKDNLGFERDISLHYVDPTTYADPERAVSELANELDRNSIKFEAIIGGGQFGDVYKGKMKLSEQLATKVAIKTLKAGASNKDRTDFLIEASVMGQFKNLNVITLEGVVTKSTPFLIVTEFMENGSLYKYLKENDGMLNPLQLLVMARGVASGMEYLARMHFVHRDLAARNVLVNDNLTCKVADFGLSRDLDNTEDSEYESQGGKIAVRWTAPEAFTYLKFSTASDIWSYGILLWEIMSFAERPYWNWRNAEVMERVAEGYRLPPPMNCPTIIHQLMKECWVSDRTKRPPFKEIVKIIDEWIKYPEKLEDYMNVRRIEPLGNSTFI